MKMNRMTRKMLQGAVLVAVAASMPAAWADGLHGVQVNNVAAGIASFSRAGNTMTIRTQTPRTIINYQQLSVASGETLQFLQPSATSRVLNRIQGNEPTVIDGTVYSNGLVYFVNPAGVMFGEGSVINAGGMIAAAGHISDANFLAGVNQFTGNTGAVTNYGVIHAGEIHLAGGSVANFGQILTTGSGVVTMTAGKDVYIGESSSPTGSSTILVKVSSDKTAVKPGTGVSNSGTVDAGGGQISMGAGDLYAAGIYNNGSLRGAVISSNSGGSSNVNEGTIDASSATVKGGSVEILGDKVGVLSGTVNASGATGGGSIKVGGDFHGDPATPASSVTVVGAGATLKADALVSGDGGTIAVWSNGATGFYGAITARGGAAGGNGGYVEVSGKQMLVFTGTVDVTAAAGNIGTLLLDPGSIDIQHESVSANDTALTSSGLSVLDGGTGSAFDISDTKINLIGTTADVSLQALTDITVDPGVAINLGAHSIALVASTGSLTLSAIPGTLTGAAITTTSGSVTLTAGGDIVMQAASGANTGATITTTTGKVSLLAGGNIVMVADSGSNAGAAKIRTTGGAVVLTATGGITMQASQNNAASINTSTGGSAAGGPVTLTAGGDILLDVLFANGVSPTITTGGGNAILQSSGGSVELKGTTLGLGHSSRIDTSNNISGNGGSILLSSGGTAGTSHGNILLFNGISLNSGGGNITLRTSSISFTNDNQTISAGTGTVAFETNNGQDTITVGEGGGSLTLLDADLATITSAGLLRIGANGGQSGEIIVGAGGSLTSVSAPLNVEINSNAGGGAVAFEDFGNSVGLVMTGNLTVRAGTGGIGAQQSTDGFPEITMAAGTTLNLVTAGQLGSASHRIELSSFSGVVNATGAATIYLTSLGTGGINFGTINNPGNDIDVVSGGDINATGVLIGANILLNASGGIGTTHAIAINLTGSGTLTTHGNGPAGNIHLLTTLATLGAFTFVTTGSGTQVDTIDSAGDLSVGTGVTAPAGDVLVVNAAGNLFAAGATVSALSLTLHAGTSGTGNLNATGADLIADTINLVAGNGSGSGVVSANGILFAGATAALPTSILVEQDLGFSDIPSLGTGAALTVLSHLGSVDISSNHSLQSLSATGTTIVLSSNATVSGAMNFNGPVVLTGNAELVGGSSLTIPGFISSSPAGFGLTTSFGGVTTLSSGSNPTVGTELGSFTPQAAGGTVSIGGGTLASLRVTGNVAINDPLVLNGTVTITSTGGGNVLFGNTVDSAGSPHSPLIVNTTGTTTFEGNVGSNTPVGGVSVLGGGPVTLGNGGGNFSMTVGSPILFSGPVTLTSNTTLTASGGATGSVTFLSTVSVPFFSFSSLTIQASDAVTFDGTIGDSFNSLGGLDVTGSSIVFGSAVGSVNVEGPMAFHAPVTLLGNLQFEGNSSISFDNVISSGTASHSALSFNNNADIGLSGGVSTASATMLQSIVADGVGGIRFGGNGPTVVETIGSQTYNRTAQQSSNVTFETATAGGTLTFAGSPNAIDTGGSTLTLISNNMVFSGNVGGSSTAMLLPLLPSNNVSIQSSSGSIANTLVLTPGGLAEFHNFSTIIIGYPNGGGTISVTAPTVFGASTLLQSPSGGSVSVASNITSQGNLSLHASTLTVGASLFTTGGTITLQGPVTLSSGPITLQSYGTAGGAGDIVIIGTIDGAQTLNLLANGPGGNGNIDLRGVTGGSVPLTGLNVSGGTFTVHNNITTAGPVNFGNSQTILSATSGTTTFALITGGNPVHITSALDASGGGTANLIVSTSAGGTAGAITLANVGGTTPLNNLTLTTTGGTNGQITLPGTLHVGGTLSTSGGGVNESASGTIQASALLLQGAGTYALGNANQVGTLAANVTGKLTFGSVSDVTVGIIGLVSGINTNGSALTLNASGHALTAAAPILAGATALTAGTITISGGLVASGTAGSLTATGTTLFNSSVSATSILVVGDSVVTANLVSTAGDIILHGNTTLAGNMTASGNVLLGLLTTDITNFSGNHFVTAGGSMSIAGPVVLIGAGGPTVLAANGPGGIAFNGGLSGAHTLKASATDGYIFFNGPVSLTGAGSTTLTSFASITASGGIATSQTLIMSANNGGIDIVGPLTLTGSGTTTLTSNGLGGVTVTGALTGSQALTIITNHSAGSIAMGPIGVSSTSRYTGTVTLTANSAPNVNGVTLNGDVFVNSIVFNGAHTTVPTVATVVSHGNLLIDAANLINLGIDQKLTVQGSLTLRSHASPSVVGIFVGDLGALGTIVIDAGGSGSSGLGRIDIRLRTPQSELSHAGSGEGTDGGTDIVSYSPTTVSAADAGFGAGNTTIAMRGNVSIIGATGPVNPGTTKVQFSSATANVDITQSADGDPNAILLFPPDQGGVLTTTHGIPILPRIILSGTALNGQAGDLSNLNKQLDASNGTSSQVMAADLAIATGPLAGTILDLVPTGLSGAAPSPSAQAALIPQDVQTLFPERGEAISGALAEALQQLGIYARPLDTDELVDELLGRGMYNDTLRVLTPVDSSHTVAVNRLPSVPVLPVVDAARALMYREERDSKGNVKLVSKTDEVAAAIGTAWQACLDESAAATPPTEPKPAEFRAWLENPKQSDAKFATALAYLNQIRDLLAQIKLLGLTPTEFDVSRRVIMNKLRDKDRIDERDFAAMIDGPSSKDAGKVALAVPAAK